jgi:hypothetical protein
MSTPSISVSVLHRRNRHGDRGDRSPKYLIHGTIYILILRKVDVGFLHQCECITLNPLGTFPKSLTAIKAEPIYDV